MSWCWLQFCVCFCCWCCCSLVLYSNPGIQLLSFVRSSEGISRFKRSQAKAFIKPPTEIKCLLSFCVCVSEVNPINHPSKKHKVFSIYTYTEKKENLAKEIFFCWKQKIASSFLLIRFFARKKSLRFFLSDNCFWREFPQRI